MPALRLLRRALPDHRVVLLGSAWVGDVSGYPVDAVTDDEGAPAPDVVVNLHGRGPQSHARLDARAGDRPVRRVGHAAPGWDGPAWVDDPERPERRRWCDLLAACGLVSDDEAAAAADDLRLPVPPVASEALSACSPHLASSGRKAPSSGPVVVHPGAAFGAKRWPVRRFAAVAAALAGDGHRVVVTGAHDEAALTGAVAAACGGLDLAGRTSLGELLALVAGARLVIAGDTGIAHVATAYGVPSVTLFGPVGPAQWGPPADPRHVVLTDASVRRGERFADDPDPALLAVTAEDVIRCARTLVGEATGPGDR
ncbi:glycosyltransferase family 9 protein [Actinomycetospora sp. TBRC 11914]|uniref:glycosyltransferase family 9 protein n=1 Tax=Actinomycetospora sp. TBRC 11914 TaxID=2729387 RepID=UPI0028A19948|nr:glycosyltransferase family 9 protein [Actinomycetospora sp. TBRC 11914]